MSTACRVTSAGATSGENPRRHLFRPAAGLALDEASRHPHRIANPWKDPKHPGHGLDQPSPGSRPDSRFRAMFPPVSENPQEGPARLTGVSAKEGRAGRRRSATGLTQAVDTKARAGRLSGNPRAVLDRCVIASPECSLLKPPGGAYQPAIKVRLGVRSGGVPRPTFAYPPHPC